MQQALSYGVGGQVSAVIHAAYDLAVIGSLFDNPVSALVGIAAGWGNRKRAGGDGWSFLHRTWRAGYVHDGLLHVSKDVVGAKGKLTPV